MQYRYTKQLRLHDLQLQLHFKLENVGETPISTQNYAHNFVALDDQPIGAGYELTFANEINPKTFGEFVDSESLLFISGNQVKWTKTPTVDFYVEHALKNSGSGKIWELFHKQCRIRLSESINFEGTHLNLWGKGHVVSPRSSIQFTSIPEKKRIGPESTRWDWRIKSAKTDRILLPAHSIR